MDKDYKINFEDEEIEKYVNMAFSEEILRRYEEQMLTVLKFRQENYPSKQNDREWLEATDYILKRRGNHK